jgi:uncharacterized protein (TIGR02996 family)
VEPAEAQLLQMVRDRPDDDAPRRVYADWLAQRDDPRGELIAVQCERASLPHDDPRHASLLQRENELLSQHAARWLGPLAGIVPADFERGFYPRPLAVTPDLLAQHRVLLLRLYPAVYEVVATIGASRDREVLEAVDHGPDGVAGWVALKWFAIYRDANPEWVDPDVVERCVAALRHELTHTELLDHPNVIRALGLAQFGGDLALALEHLDGMDLHRLLEAARRQGITLAPALCANVIQQVCLALHHVHTATDAENQPLQMIHREVRPEHVFVTASGVVKLIDFGWARSRAAQLDPFHDGPHGVDDDQLSPDPAGKDDSYRFAYMSPEQVSGLPLDNRSDLFSAGTLLYEMLCGRNPFLGQSPVATLEAVRRAHAPIPRPHVRVPPALERVIQRALEPDPERRFSTAFEMYDALGAVMRAENWPAGPELVARVMRVGLG